MAGNSSAASAGARISFWITLVAAGATIAMLLLAGPGYRLGVVDLRTALLTLFRWSAYLAGATAVLALIATIWNFASGARGTAFAALVILLAAGTLGLNDYRWGQRGAAAAPIHDISTDTVNPPQFVAVAPLRADAPNPAAYDGRETAMLQAKAYPDIHTLQFQQPVREVFDAALATANDMGWKIQADEPDEGRIEATDTTAFMGFKDDIVIRVRQQNGGTALDIRSKSRVGRSDIGTNARRIRAFRDALNQRLS